MGDTVTDSKKCGVFYGVGVGPGDPELLTRKAERILRAAYVLAAPDSGAGASMALGIVGELERGKRILFCPAPMTRDKSRLRAAWDEGAALICGELEQGRSVAFVTLGDPGIYSTCGYLLRRVRQRGFETQLVPGVPSFCAAAALGVSLCQGREPLTIVPASSPELEAALTRPGARVVMKAAARLETLQTLLERQGELDGAVLVENCGLTGERSLPLGEADRAGYFSTVIIPTKEKNQ
jgi:precorrin-2/cobalt-factor-2 C20-methyltransferase